MDSQGCFLGPFWHSPSFHKLRDGVWEIVVSWVMVSFPNTEQLSFDLLMAEYTPSIYLPAPVGHKKDKGERMDCKFLEKTWIFILWDFGVRIHPTFVVPMVYRKPPCTTLIINRFSLREWMTVLWPLPQEAGPESCLRIWISILPSALEQWSQNFQVAGARGGCLWESIFSVVAISHRGLWRQVSERQAEASWLSLMVGVSWNADPKSPLTLPTPTWRQKQDGSAVTRKSTWTLITHSFFCRPHPLRRISKMAS